MNGTRLIFLAWLTVAGAPLAAAPKCAALERRAAQTADPDATVWNEVARCRLKAGKLVSAVEALDAAIGATGPGAEDSDEPEAIEETIRQTERALLKATLTRAIADATKVLATRSLAMGNYERAHRLFERSLKAKGFADESPPADWNLVARARIETDDLRGAAEAFLRAGAKVSGDIDLLQSALPSDDVPAEGGWQARCLSVDPGSRKRCNRAWLACFSRPTVDPGRVSQTSAVLIDIKTISRWVSEPSLQRPSSGLIEEWQQVAKARGEMSQSLRVVAIDACAGAVIEVSSRFEDNDTRHTTVTRREVKPAAP